MKEKFNLIKLFTFATVILIAMDAVSFSHEKFWTAEIVEDQTSGNDLYSTGNITYKNGNPIGILVECRAFERGLKIKLLTGVNKVETRLVAHVLVLTDRGMIFNTLKAEGRLFGEKYIDGVLAELDLAQSKKLLEAMKAAKRSIEFTVMPRMFDYKAVVNHAFEAASILNACLKRQRDNN